MLPTLLLLLAMLWTGNASAQEVTNRLRLNEVKNRPRLNEVKNRPRLNEVKNRPRLNEVKNRPRLNEVGPTRLSGLARTDAIIVWPPIRHAHS